MANIVTLVSCVILAGLLLLSIILAGYHLLVPATFMIVTVFVGGLCVYVAGGILDSRKQVMKDWEARNPE